MKKQQLAEIVSKIKEMERKMFELVLMWEQADPEVQEALADHFPFHKSFDELHAGVQEWHDELKSKLENF